MSMAMYRFTMAGDSPSTIAVDPNPALGSSYFVGIRNYATEAGRGTARSAGQVALSLNPRHVLSG